MPKPLRATVNCDLGEGYSLYKIADDEALMQTIHLANVACGFHASDFSIMNETVYLAKKYDVRVGAHPSLPDRQGFGRREMSISPDDLKSCFIYQVGALSGFLRQHGLPLNHIKPHGAVYGQIARSLPLARAVVDVAKIFGSEGTALAIVGLVGSAQQVAAQEAGIPFLPEWFADLDYDDQGKLLITQKHESIPLVVVRERVLRLLKSREITTVGGNYLPIGENVDEVTICCHSDTPGAVQITQLVKALVDEHNAVGPA
ncbi:LamB/YcsF [Pluteus cervinus]|uniref:LamB/YcsF n=1 Tax=Pluteus cervinus TaxID=181527 RepID=A0ACD3B0S7_9AGAR|nr:LamB/YcsF [Pluteus cervinus]